MSEVSTIAGGWIEMTIPVSELVRRLGWWVAGTAVGAAGLFAAVNGWASLIPPPPTAEFLGSTARGVLILVGVYVVSVPVHEGLHAVGMIMTGTPRAAISFGARLLQGVVFIHCERPMTLRAYRISLLLPVVVTGILPLVAGAIMEAEWVVAYGALMVVSAVGDLEMIWKLRRLPADTPVRDHPDLLGCEVQLGRSGSRSRTG